MFRIARTVITLAAAASLTPLLAIEPDRDFSGKWIYDSAGSNTRSISVPQARLLTVDVQDNTIQCSSIRSDGSPLQWNFALNGTATRYRLGEENHNSEVKWEGNALLVSTIVTGPQNYSIMDRWMLSRDRGVLTIERQTMRNGNESEGVLHYRREGQPVSANTQPAREPAFSGNTPPPAPPANTPPPAPQAALTRTPASTPPAEIVVRAGTRIPLSLRNAIDTKHSHEGDRVYLDTIYPIVVNNRIVIPRGSYVSGTLTIAKPAGVVKGKGELFIRFDSLILPNGVTRDFRSRLASADTTHGKVDHQEGTITGERDKAGQAKTTAEGAGIGAGIGGLAGAAAGHPISGLGIGAAAGAAAGLASVLIKHRPDASLPRGTTVEMLLDRDISYIPSELPFHRP